MGITCATCNRPGAILGIVTPPKTRSRTIPLYGGRDIARIDEVDGYKISVYCANCGWVTQPCSEETAINVELQRMPRR